MSTREHAASQADGSSRGTVPATRRQQRPNYPATWDLGPMRRCCPAADPERDQEGRGSQSRRAAAKANEREGAGMRAQVGDRLVLDGDESRVGLIIGLHHEDGSPPYVVRWLADGHVALVYPGPYTRIMPPRSGETKGKQPPGASCQR